MLIFKVTKNICMIGLICLATVIVGCGTNEREKVVDFHSIDSKTLGINITKEIRILEQIDDHDDFLGDGQSYTVYQFNDAQSTKVINQLRDKPYWEQIDKPLKIDKELQFNMKGELQSPKFGMPKELVKGFSFYKPKTAEELSPEEVKKRKSEGTIFTSYIFALFDIDTKRLYVYEFDS